MAKKQIKAEHAEPVKPKKSSAQPAPSQKTLAAEAHSKSVSKRKAGAAEAATDNADTAATGAADGAGDPVKLKSMGRKQLSLAAAVTDAVSPPPLSVAMLGYQQEQLPKISHVAGSALQADIQALNQAVIRLLKTAARLGPVEPLAPLLLGTSPQMIELFESEVMGERLLAQSLGFPLVQLRIHDVGVMRQMLSDGIVSASSVQSITHSFPLEVIEAASRRRYGV